jgi:hypothetical protein
MEVNVKNDINRMTLILLYLSSCGEFVIYIMYYLYAHICYNKLNISENYFL